jgi:hypothetical protein
MEQLLVLVMGRIGDIPEKWRDLLGQRDYNEKLAEKLCSRTGFAWEEALAVDVAAYGAYYLYMLGIHDTLGTDVTDMSDFIDWKRKFWQ